MVVVASLWFRRVTVVVVTRFLIVKLRTVDDGEAWLSRGGGCRAFPRSKTVDGGGCCAFPRNRRGDKAWRERLRGSQRFPHSDFVVVARFLTVISWVTTVSWVTNAVDFVGRPA